MVVLHHPMPSPLMEDARAANPRCSLRRRPRPAAGAGEEGQRCDWPAEQGEAG